MLGFKFVNMDNPTVPRLAFGTSMDDSSCSLKKSLRLPRSQTTTMAQNSSIIRQNALVTSELSSLATYRRLKLSSVQKQALQNTWRIIKDNNADRMCERIFQKLISTQSKVKDVFYKAACLTVFTRSNSITTHRDHARLFHRMLNDLITNLEKSDQILSQFRECGIKHVFLRQNGFKADIWEHFGGSAIEVINEQDCVKSNLEAMKAWTILIASITDEMRQGFEKEVRRQSYTMDRPKSSCE